MHIDKHINIKRIQHIIQYPLSPHPQWQATQASSSKKNQPNNNCFTSLVAAVHVQSVCSLAPCNLAKENSKWRIKRKELSHLIQLRPCGRFHLRDNIFFADLNIGNNNYEVSFRISNLGQCEIWTPRRHIGEGINFIRLCFLGVKCILCKNLKWLSYGQGF